MHEPITQRRRALRRSGSTARQSSGKFAAGRATAVDRVVRSGIPRAMAEAWIEAWDESTAELHDFRDAPDFWTQGFRYALEEYQRGYRPPWPPDRSGDERDPSLQ
jgi:phosphohistidine phosphatase SixA